MRFKLGKKAFIERRFKSVAIFCKQLDIYFFPSRIMPNAELLNFLRMAYVNLYVLLLQRVKT